VQWPRPRVEDLEDLYMPGEWPLARLKEPVSMLAPLQSCVCSDSMDGCAVCAVTSSRMAHRVRSSWQSTYHSMGSKMQRRYPPISRTG
jgi:hypothetical protein